MKGGSFFIFLGCRDKAEVLAGPPRHILETTVRFARPSGGHAPAET